jgi:hypothetical protein
VLFILHFSVCILAVEVTKIAQTILVKVVAAESHAAACTSIVRIGLAHLGFVE